VLKVLNKKKERNPVVSEEKKGGGYKYELVFQVRSKTHEKKCSTPLIGKCKLNLKVPVVWRKLKSLTRE
jgi:hypothetical protein